MENIGKTIKELRKKFGIVQEQLAEDIGISQSYLSLIERGEREPSLSLIRDVSKVLRVPEQLIFLLSWDGAKLPKGCAKPFKRIMNDVNEIFQLI